MAPRLSLATLGRVPGSCRPLVLPGDAAPGIVHLGLGAFHRAHQAVYTEAAIAAEPGDWAIVGVAPRRRPLIDTLAGQDGLFSVTSVDGDGSATRVVGALAGVRHAPSDPAAVVGLIADPGIRTQEIKGISCVTPYSMSEAAIVRLLCVTTMNCV